jgi:signal peptidase II
LSGRGGVLIKAVLVCAAVVAADQLSKGIVREQIARGDSVQVLPFLDFENTRNRGIAFGLAGDVSPALIAVAIVALLGLLGFLSLRREADPMIWLPAGLLVGGALGNLADRVRDGAVTDFIDFPGWPTFNLADVSIVVGVALLVLLPEIRARSSGDD